MKEQEMCCRWEAVESDLSNIDRVDDGKTGRELLLLKRRKVRVPDPGKQRMRKDALGVLESNHVDILFLM